MTKHARRLRKQPTDAEKKLWRALRRDQMNGLSFRRQHPIGSYVLDFYCPTIRLAIEVDGGQHNMPPTSRHDERRTLWLQDKGITVIRFCNNDVLQNLDGVLQEIALATARYVSSSATPSLALPLSGGGNASGSPGGENASGSSALNRPEPE